MEWNDGKERAKFEREQAKLREQYLAAGMSEEQIKALYAHDLEWYKNRRREARHTQRLDLETCEEIGEYIENPLYKKFFDKLAVEDKHSETTRFGWVEEIEDRRLYEAVKKLSADDLELLTQVFFEGVSQIEIARRKGVNKATVTKWIRRIKKLFQKFF